MPTCSTESNAALPLHSTYSTTLNPNSLYSVMASGGAISTENTVQLVVLVTLQETVVTWQTRTTTKNIVFSILCMWLLDTARRSFLLKAVREEKDCWSKQETDDSVTSGFRWYDFNPNDNVNVSIYGKQFHKLPDYLFMCIVCISDICCHWLGIQVSGVR